MPRYRLLLSLYSFGYVHFLPFQLLKVEWLALFGLMAKSDGAENHLLGWQTYYAADEILC